MSPQALTRPLNNTILRPSIHNFSFVWVLCAPFSIECADVVRLWGFCGIYVYNSMAVQLVIHGGDL